MKKIYKNWRDDVLNEFAPSYDLDDQEAGIEQYMTPSSDLVQKAIQDSIDANMGLHVSGRPIDSKLLAGLLKENDIKEIVGKIKDDEIQDYLRLLPDKQKCLDIASGIDAMLISLLRLDRYLSPTITGLALNINIMLSNELLAQDGTYKEVLRFLDNSTSAIDLISRSQKLKVVTAIRLFTAASVSTVRKPNDFDPEKAQIASESDSVEKFESLSDLIKNIYKIYDISNMANKWGLKFGYNYQQAIKPLSRIDVFEGYFDRLANKLVSHKQLGNVFATDRYLNIAEEQLASIGHSTRSRKFNELLARIKRCGVILEKLKQMKEKQQNLSAIPTKDSYAESNKILTTLSTTKTSREKEIHRGMFVDGLKIDDIQVGMEFDFHTISSWSESKAVGESFSGPGENSGEGLSIIFSMKPKRGCSIASLSGFPSEKEFLTGGRVKIIRIDHTRKVGSLNKNSYMRVFLECEHI